MNDLIIPLYSNSNRKSLLKIDSLNIKTLLIILFLISFIAIYLLFLNLPSDAKTTLNNSVNLKELFIPDIRQQNPAPPIIHDVPPSLVVVQPQAQPQPKPQETQRAVEQASTNDEDANKKREKIRDMMRASWTNYVQYAWGHNELKPLSRTGHSAGIFGVGTRLGATIVDGLDTLYIMGFKEEYLKGKEWIENSFNFNTVDADVSAFEMNIRFVGGFLSLHSLTGEKVFLDKAVQVADALLPIFNTPTGLPNALVNIKQKTVSNYHWASGGCTILSEAGTLILEFLYLSDATGNPIYKEKVLRVQTVLNEVEKELGLYYNYINPKTGKWCMKHASVGALGDSFYEYLLKTWLYTNKTDSLSLKMYLESMDAIQKNMILQSEGGLTFIGEFKSNRIERKMDHLACFIVGLFAMTAKYVDTITPQQRETYRQLAVNVTHTCHESYARTPTKIGPEAFHFERLDTEAQAIRQNERYYILRPEVIESYFYSWRLTKDEKYRQWAWEAVEAIEKYCKTDAGYSGLRDVYNANTEKDDVQQSFFLAETLKYLYLIFSDDSVLPLDKYVFNTEAHPLRIRPK